MPGRRVEDPKQAYTSDQLAEIGGITLLWNSVEGFVDWLIKVALDLPLEVMWEVASRIAGMEAKIEILRLRAARSEILDDDARACIKLSLDAVGEYKKYRDNIVHSVPYDIDRGIAHRVNRRAELLQTLVTLEALTGLYQRMKLVLDELREVDLLFRLADERSPIVVRPAAGKELDQLELRRRLAVPQQTARLRDRQQARLSLPLLPLFPDEASVAEQMESPTPHQHHEEKDRT